MIPILYQPNETLFSSMGLGPLPDAISCMVTEERNGLFEFSMKYPVDGLNVDQVAYEQIIVMDASPLLPNQRFIVTRIYPADDEIVLIEGEHISQYVTRNAQLNPHVTFSGNAQAAITRWKDNLIGASRPVTVQSSITLSKSGSWNIDKVPNARKALGGVEGSMLDLYGGEFKFDNLNINLMLSRGADKGALIAYGKNITSFEQEKEIASTVTSIQPYAVIYNTETGNESVLYLPEGVLHSPNANNFAQKKIDRIDFTNPDVKTVAELRTKAQAYLEDSEIGVPKVSMTLSFVDLRNTLDYTNGFAEDIDLCDWVYVDFEKLGINRVRSKVVKTTYNVLFDRYESIELGTVKNRFSSNIATLSTVKKKVTPLYTSVRVAQATADGKNTIYYGTEQPENPVKNDQWHYPLVDGETELKRFDGTQWIKILGTGDISEAHELAEQANSEAQQAISKSDSALMQINTAVSNAGFSTLDELLQGISGDIDDLFDADQSLVQRTNTIETTLDGTTQTISQITGTADNSVTVNLNQLKSTADSTSLLLSDLGYTSGNMKPNRIVSLEANLNGIQTTVGNSSSGLVSQFTQLDSGFSLLSSTVDLLQLERLNLVHNISGTKTLTDSGGRTWTATGGGERQYGTYTNAVNGKDTFAVILKADGWAQLASNYFKIDPSKAYRFSCWLRSTKPTGESAGFDAFGLLVRANGSNNPIALTPVSRSSGTTGDPTTSTYFSSVLTLGDWKEYVGYLVPETISSLELKAVGKNIYFNYIMPSNATSACMRIVNSYNNVSESRLILAYPVVTEVSIGEIESQAQLSILNDNINLRVTKAQLLSEINVQAGNVLIRSGDNKLNITPATTYIQSATIKSAMIADGSIGTAKIGTIDASIANIINLNVNNLVANKASFIQALFNGTNSMLKIASNEVAIKRTDGSSSLILNYDGMIVQAYNGRKMGYVGISNVNSGSEVYGLLLGAYSGNDMIFGWDIQRDTGDYEYKKAMQVSYQGYIDMFNPVRIYRWGMDFVESGYSGSKLRMNGSTIEMGNGKLLTGASGLIDFSQGTANVSNWIRPMNNRIEIGGDGETILKIGRGGARYLDAYAPLNMNGYTISGQSDERLKENISQWHSVLDDIKDFYFAQFTWKDKQKPRGLQYGIIAQSAPFLSQQGEDGYLVIDNMLETHMALKGVQELLYKTESIEERIERLENELNELRNFNA